MAVTSDGDGSDEWGEAFDDHGFIYRTRRHARNQSSVASDATEVTESTEENERELRRRRRQQRLRCLKGLREKYKQELEKWERLSSSVNQLSEQVPAQPTVNLGSEKVDVSQSMRQLEDRGHDRSIDELLIQVECQEAIFRKIEEMCSEVDVLCEEREEQLANMLIELPIWSSPRTLLKSLSN